MLNQNVKHAQMVNTAMVYAVLELGTCVMEEILGGDEASNQVSGKPYDRDAIRNDLAITVAKAFGA